MAKRAKIEVNSHSELRDRMNTLPDELLVRILGFLSLKEAVATSILCRRWRYLWTLTNKLNFDGLDFFPKIWSRVSIPRNFNNLAVLSGSWRGTVPEESLNYIAWVNHVLGSHKCSSIDEFRIDLFFSECHKTYIDRWLRFASARKVQNLELNLKMGTSYKRYPFRPELWISFKHLRTLRLKSVQVSGEDLELILRTNPFLEELSVTLSYKLAAVKIIGPSPELKRLELNSCAQLTSVEIHDANLVFFMYNRIPLQRFVLKNVPHLVEIYVGGDIIMKDFLSRFSSYLPQLEKLTLDTGNCECFDRKEAMMLYNSVKMSNLKQLVVKYLGGRVHLFDLMTLTYFIRASPLLQSFVLEDYSGDTERKLSSYFVNRLPDKVEAMGSYRYPHLKRVEVIGYRGKSSELNLVVHLLKNGAALQDIINLRKRDNSLMSYDFIIPNSLAYPCGQEQVNALKANVKDQLTKGLPSPLPFNLSIL